MPFQAIETQSSTKILLRRAAAVLTLLLATMLISAVSLAQTVADFPRDDNFLVLEFDRYSLKLYRPDTTPMLRVYGSGRAQIYFSALSAKAGLYEIKFSEAKLEELLRTIVTNDLHQDVSTAMAEAAEKAAIRQADSEVYYSSDATVTVMNLYFSGASKQPVLAENLQDSDRRFPNLPGVSAYASLERKLLKLIDGDLGAPVAQAKSVDQAKQP